MDEMFDRLNRIYPNSKFVLISKYNPYNWTGQEYDSSLDKKAALKLSVSVAVVIMVQMELLSQDSLMRMEYMQMLYLQEHLQGQMNTDYRKV